MNQSISNTDLRVLYEVIGGWPIPDVVTLPPDPKGSLLLNRHLGQIARAATAAAKRIFDALEQNDDGVSWNSERRKKDAALLLFSSLAQVRLLGISDSEIKDLLKEIAAEGGPQ